MLLVEGKADPHGFGHEFHTEGLMDAVADGAGEVHDIGGCGLAAVGQRQRVLRRERGPAGARIALGKPGAINEPGGGELFPAGLGRGVAGHGVRGGVAKRGTDLGLDGVGKSGVHHRVGEEGAGGPGVMVGGVEHHTLAAAELEDLLADLGHGAALAGILGELAKAQRAGKALVIELQLHLQHHGAAGEFQVGIAIGQLQVGGGDPLIGIGAAVIKAHAGKDLGDLRAIGTHILHGDRAHGAGDAGKALDAAQAELHGAGHYVIPDGAGLRAHHAGFGVHGDLVEVEDDRDEIHGAIGHQEVGAAANDDEFHFGVIKGTHHGNGGLRLRAAQCGLRFSAYTQRSQVREGGGGVQFYPVDLCELLRQRFIKHAYQGSLLGMSTRSENTVTINQPIEKVHKALLTKEYWEYIVANLSPEAGQVHDFSDNVATLFEVLPTTLLPEAVRAMVSQDLKVKRVVTVGELNGEAADVNYTADVKGTPVDFKGDISLAGEGEMTKLSYVNEISVNIPMMGAAIEPKVGESLAELFDNEGKLTEQWISENA